MKSLNIRFAFLLTTLFLISSCAVIANENNLAFTGEKENFSNKKGDYKFCGDNNYSNGRRVSVKDLREITVASAGVLEVDGKRNGGISVKGENRGDVLIRACVRAWADSESEATAAVKSTRIETSGVIRAVNDSEDTKFSVSYDIRVPSQTDLKLSARNGGISIKSVEGRLEFETRNGGVSLRDVGGSVKGITRNGGVSVKLSGPAWSGEGLDVETRNGGVSLYMPSNYAANVETGTVNGGFKSDFSELKIEKDDRNRWSRPKRVSASLNGGGAKIRVVTTNGGVRIKSSSQKQ